MCIALLAPLVSNGCTSASSVESVGRAELAQDLEAPAASMSWRMTPRFVLQPAAEAEPLPQPRILVSEDEWGDEGAPYDITFQVKRARRYVHETEFEVILSACNSTDADGLPGGVEGEDGFSGPIDTGGSYANLLYTWYAVDQDGGNVELAQKQGRDCELRLNLEEAEYSFQLVVEDLGRGTTASTFTSVRPKHLVIASLGDSVASGEGNPDREIVRNGDGEVVTSAGWTDLSCHRSRWSGPARAAEMIERNDPHSSVTFLSVACSGATLMLGLDVTGEGQYDEDADHPPPPEDFEPIVPVDQLELLAWVLCKGTTESCRTVVPGGGPLRYDTYASAIRQPDALLVSAGGNDMLFGPVAEACANPLLDCLDEEADFVGTLRDQVERAPDKLLDAYDEFAEMLDRYLISSDRVFVTEYGDPSRDDDGDYCDALYFTSLVIPADHVPLPLVDAEIAGDDLEEIDEVLFQPLNETLETAADRHGFHFVDGIARDFRTHGYCSSEPWFRYYLESLSIQGDRRGTLHPNKEGHVAIGYRIADAILENLAAASAPEEPPPPRLPEDFRDRSWNTTDAMLRDLQQIFGRNFVGALRPTPGPIPPDWAGTVIQRLPVYGQRPTRTVYGGVSSWAFDDYVLGIDSSGYREFATGLVDAWQFEEVGNRVSIDAYLTECDEFPCPLYSDDPPTVPPPWEWQGAIQLYATVKNADGIDLVHQFIDQVELAGLSRDETHVLTFDVPSYLEEAMLARASVKFHLAVNTPTAEKRQVSIGGIRFSGEMVPHPLAGTATSVPRPVVLPGSDEPSCEDGVENGSETGVDCGGSCVACPIACNVRTYEAEAIEHSTGGAVSSGWALYSNGNVSTLHDFSAGKARVVVRARGQTANGVAPRLVLRVGGEAIGTANVTSASFAPYTFTFTQPPGNRQIQLAFDNDYYAPPQDRNLFLDQLTVDCDVSA
ncbi:MAG TPA: carbohydrate-binding domain-containing protein, partial [Polyangiaceae bacterium]